MGRESPWLGSSGTDLNSPEYQGVEETEEERLEYEAYRQEMFGQMAEVGGPGWEPELEGGGGVYPFGEDEYGTPIDPVFGEPDLSPQTRGGDPVFDDDIPW